MKRSKEHSQAFQKLKDALIEVPVLRVADLSNPYTLQKDGSERGLGALLSQVDEHGEEHPIAFASRKLLPQEMNYSPTKKECLALVKALKFFHVY